MPRSSRAVRNVCFVTGTRAEFGLMQSVLRAIQSHKRLRLQLIVTGMHLDRAHGDGLAQITDQGWTIDWVIPWEADAGRDRRTTARNTGVAVAALADAFAELQSDLVVVVGDRVEAFAGAAAAHISGIAVAHLHGGDRAVGQVDDSLRHAITKLAHVHFPATPQSARRLKRLGEDAWRIHCVGAPGLDGIVAQAAIDPQIRRMAGPLTTGRYALIVLHPFDADEPTENCRAQMMLRAVRSVPFEQIVIVYPNNDPGAGGIIECWDSIEARNGRLRLHRDLPRPIFLGLLRDAAVLVGNSSSGIIEAASFGTPVLNVGSRQKGRERGGNVVDVPYDGDAIGRELKRLWNRGRPKRARSKNIYGGQGAGRRMAAILARLRLDERLLRKLIDY